MGRFLDVSGAVLAHNQVITRAVYEVELCVTLDGQILGRFVFAVDVTRGGKRYAKHRKFSVKLYINQICTLKLGNAKKESPGGSFTSVTHSRGVIQGGN